MHDALFVRQLATRIIQAVEAKGTPLGPDRYLQMEEVLAHLPEHTDPLALRAWLAPLLCTDAETQREFAVLFDQAYRELVESQLAPPSSSPSDGETQGEAAETRARRWLLAAIAALVLFAGFLFSRSNPITWLVAAAALAGGLWAAWSLPKTRTAKALFALALLLALGLGHVAKEAWIRRQASPPVPEPTPQAPIRTQTIRFSLLPGEVQRRDLRASPGDTAVCSWEGSAGLEAVSALGLRCSLDGSRQSLAVEAPAAAALSEAREDTLRLYRGQDPSLRDTLLIVLELLPPPAPTSAQATSLPIPYPHSPAEWAVDPDALARAELLKKYQWHIKALLWGLLTLALWAFLVWLARKRARIVAEITAADRPPYVWHIETGEELRPDFGEAMALLLNRLRRREAGEALRLDLSASVRATVKSGGYAQFVFKEQTRPPEYLLLIDRYHPHDHRARLFDALYTQLKAADVLVERYFFNGHPGVLFSEAHPHGIRLRDVMQRHADDRLLLVADGDGLFSPDGAIAPWTDLLRQWRRRALLLTKPTDDWGRREAELATVFHLAPASIAGLDLALEQLETLEQKSNADILRRVQDAPEQAFEVRGDLMAALHAHFPTPMVRWIAACALWPALYWDLTCYLGRLIDPALVRADALRQLSRLPWFVVGRIPDGARRILIEYLRQQGLEQKFRQALHALLSQASAPPVGSVAYADHRMSVILNQLMLQPDPAERKKLEREFENYLAAGKKPDFVTFKLLDRAPTTLDQLVPDRWKKYIFRGENARFGLRIWPQVALGALLAGLGIGLWPVRTELCPGGELVAYRAHKLCLQTSADRLRYLEYLAADAIAEGDTLRLDSLNAAAFRLAPADTVFCHNTSVRCYNRTVEAPADSAWACAWLMRADSLYRRPYGRAAAEYLVALRARGCLPTAAPADTAAAEPLILSGVVADAVTGAPIPNATVTAGDLQAVTDAQGRYTLSLDARALPASLLFRATAPGYLPGQLRSPVRAELPVLALRPIAPDPEAEQTDWEKAVTVNTIAAYQAFIERYPSSPRATEAAQHVDDLSYQAAEAANTPEAYRDYLNRFPQGRHRQAAEEKLRPAPPRPDMVIIRQPPRPDMVFIRGGTFRMGCTSEQRDCDSDESPTFEATVSDFYLGRYEVTFEEYDAFCEATGREKPDDRGWGRGKRPVINVSWYDAVEYCNWLSEQQGLTPYYAIDKSRKDPNNGSGVDALKWLVTPRVGGNGYRLPTEAEWEYAARGGGKSVLFGNGKNVADPSEINFDGSESWKKAYSVVGVYREKTVPVGSLNSPNGLGLHDMSGNVYEWCWDWYGAYSSSSKTNPRGPERGSSRVNRGGSWRSYPQLCRVAFRNRSTPTLRSNSVGFRLARS